MAFITDAQLKTALAARLQTTSAALLSDAPHWDTLVTECNERAYQEILSVLLGRGFSSTQISGWDRREEFNKRIGVCFLLEDGSVNNSNVNPPMVEVVCKCREELKTVDLVVSGSIVDPVSGNVPVNYGDRDDSLDTFTRDTEW